MQIGMLISSAAVIRPTWTTAHLAHAALQAGHSIRFIEPHDMEVTTHGRLVTRAHVLDHPLESPTEVAQQLSGLHLTRRFIDVPSLDMLFMRANPLTPAVLNLALMAQEYDVRVVNDPIGIAKTRSKTWLAALSAVPRPATLITSDGESARLFAESNSDGVVIKPSMGSGGRGVRHVLDPKKVARAVGEVMRLHPGPTVIQAYLPEAEEGEKRVFWVDGHIVGGYLRRRAPGAFHHNLQRGGQPEATAITESDRTICDAIAPHLRRNGIAIAGLDIIGSALVECNTLNPGGVHYAESFRTSGNQTIANRTIKILTQSRDTAEAIQS
jgi:glutathione synthase